jgi:acyl-CoA reductase-like NAD-dependent aldehyde dehydrogenase
MPTRLDIAKTFKLFINGAFPRSESGRTTLVSSPSGEPLAHVAKASRKDLREAVEAARAALPKWSEGTTAYNRGQILYRIAEMMEGKREEFVGAITSVGPDGAGTPSKSKAASKKPARSTRPLAPQAEVDLAIDRVVHYAGWADKHAQVLGCCNPVAGPFYTFTSPEPVGVVAVVSPRSPSLLSLVSLLAPALATANTCVTLASEHNPLIGALLGETLATSDVPPGVVNILTCDHAELLPIIAAHRDIDAVHAAGLAPAHAGQLHAGAAENVKRVTIHTPLPDWTSVAACEHPGWLEPLVEFKTIWHPASS